MTESPVSSDVAAAYAQVDAIDVPFLRDVVVALVVTGRDLELDLELQTIDVDALDPELDRVLGVVRPLARSVAFYAVHDTRIPASALGAALELAARANAEEFDSTIEVDPAAGSFSVRASVALGDVEVGAEVLGRLLGVALDAVEDGLRRYRPAIEAVSQGRASAYEAAMQVRRAQLDG